ncbi:TPA: hypothetical protein N0F65_003711 [Lagenidium giganteum]|uniref:Ankyrin repeat-containing domain n=1 Tax=Lagenidium giganteum TaxID=4803 RepID=A0AAV2Z2R9_9STRA|nr:TPA: hypothetical protein N0F65_003711 [Lagenidium giganteum]
MTERESQCMTTPNAASRVFSTMSMLHHIMDYVPGIPRGFVAFVFSHVTPEKVDAEWTDVTGIVPILAIRHCNRQVLDSVFKLLHVPYFRALKGLQLSGALNEAVQTKNVELFEWVCDAMGSLSWPVPPFFFYSALRENPTLSLPMVQSIYARSRGEKPLYKLFPVEFNQAVVLGRLDLVQWIHTHTEGFVQATAFIEAAHRGHLDIVKYFHEQDFPSSTDVMDVAARQGNLAIVEFLHRHRTEGCTTNAMDDAAEGGHLKVVRFLDTHRAEGCTTSAMDSAARNGYVAVVKYLHENRAEGCTSDAMDLAASMGMLEVVRYLHSHRTEGCTPLAMDLAASNGWLNVVRFLHENRREGCTQMGLVYAAGNGHLDIVQFLVQERSEGCLVEALTAAKQGFARSYDTDARVALVAIMQYLTAHTMPGRDQCAATSHAPNCLRPCQQQFHMECQ